MTTAILEGGCLCGSVRYRVTAAPVAVSYCHCPSCRRASGAPATAWAMFAEDAFAWTGAAPARYGSSPGVERTFCGTCGTPLVYLADALPGLVDVTVGSFDEPAALAPAMHIWESRRLPWLRIEDGLPRHAEFPPFGEEEGSR
jgi:hypothetical protein